MATTTTADFPLATENPFRGGGEDAGAGTAGAAPGSVADGSAAGASGSSSGSLELSRGGLIAIVIVVVFIALVGIASTVLFFIAKKREWTMKETLRRSARKVVTALTPRRSEFPKSVKDSVGRGGRMNKLDDVPPTPRIKPSDLEKGNGSRNLTDKRMNFSRK
ncbi:hypothetical protein B0T16DRAFT_461295 [Cercophora newfieldiana]|uniref:Uncharacterized protein n=1 Tax=Cercophora newfieldiana TaxID=92897 RepID=A0AA39XXI2_9PEZI|nr:hypothetical protein B0T16DRAFT_461295 [Cercophora newfieldiana]